MRDDHLAALLEADAALARRGARTSRRRLAFELGRHGLFVRMGRVEAYLCREGQRAWSDGANPAASTSGRGACT